MHKWGLQGGGEARHLKGEVKKESEKEGVACAKILRIEQSVAQGRDTEREEEAGLRWSWKDEYIPPPPPSFLLICIPTSIFFPFLPFPVCCKVDPCRGHHPDFLAGWLIVGLN